MKAMSFEEYDRLSEGGGLVPVYREMPGDLMTPVSAFRAISARSPRAFLLESVAGGERLARYSFLGRDPVSTLEARTTGLTEDGPEGRRPVAGTLLAAVRTRVGRSAADVPDLPRFTGGAVGYLTYDAVRLFEKIPARHPARAQPIASFSFYRSLVAFDHARQRLVLIADVDAGRRSAFADAQDALDALQQDLTRPPEAARHRVPAGPIDGGSVLGDGDGFLAGVAISFNAAMAKALEEQRGVHAAGDQLDGDLLLETLDARALGEEHLGHTAGREALQDSVALLLVMRVGHACGGV